MRLFLSIVLSFVFATTNCFGQTAAPQVADPEATFIAAVDVLKKSVDQAKDERCKTLATADRQIVCIIDFTGLSVELQTLDLELNSMHIAAITGNKAELKRASDQLTSITNSALKHHAEAVAKHFPKK